MALLPVLRIAGISQGRRTTSYIEQLHGLARRETISCVPAGRLTQRKEWTMKAKVGDWLVVKGATVEQPDQRGEITEVRSADGSPPYVVRWFGTITRPPCIPAPMPLLSTPQSRRRPTSGRDLGRRPCSTRQITTSRADSRLTVPWRENEYDHQSRRLPVDDGDEEAGLDPAGVPRRGPPTPARPI